MARDDVSQPGEGDWKHSVERAVVGMLSVAEQASFLHRLEATYYKTGYFDPNGYPHAIHFKPQSARSESPDEWIRDASTFVKKCFEQLHLDESTVLLVTTDEDLTGVHAVSPMGILATLPRITTEPGLLFIGPWDVRWLVVFDTYDEAHLLYSD